MQNKEYYLVKEPFEFVDDWNRWHLLCDGEIIIKNDNNSIYTINGIDTDGIPYSYGIAITDEKFNSSQMIKYLLKIKETNIKTAKLLFQNK